MPYLVGERGPENFVPGAAGRIETNGALRNPSATGKVGALALQSSTARGRPLRSPSAGDMVRAAVVSQDGWPALRAPSTNDVACEGGGEPTGRAAASKGVLGVRAYGGPKPAPVAPPKSAPAPVAPVKPLSASVPPHVAAERVSVQRIIAMTPKGAEDECGDAIRSGMPVVEFGGVLAARTILEAARFVRGG